jgi:hypothetical protein
MSRFVMLGTIRAVLVVAVAALVFAGCSDDKEKSTPEVIDSSGSARGRGGPEAPHILGTSSGATIAGFAPIASSPGFFAVTSALGVTVQHAHSETVDADDAFAVVLIAARPTGPTPFFQVAERDRAELFSAMEALGVSREDVTIDSDFRVGPFVTISARVPFDDRAERARQVIEATERVMGRAQSSGLRLAVKDCAAALAAPRAEALRLTHEKALALADAAGLTLGRLIALSEGAVAAGPYTPQDPCSGSPTGVSLQGGGLLPLEAEPRVRLSVVLTASYEIERAEATLPSGLAVSGVGTVRARANEAYVVAIVESFSGPGPRTPTQRERDELVEKIGRLGVKKEDIEFGNLAIGGPLFVSIDVEPKSLPKLGEDITRAVEEVFGRSQQSGAVFTHTNCEAVKALAREEAVKVARKNGEALARATGLRISGLSLIAEGGPPSPYGPPLDPCAEDISLIFVTRGYGGGVLKPFDAEPEFEVSVSVSALFAFE